MPSQYKRVVLFSLLLLFGLSGVLGGEAHFSDGFDDAAADNWTLEPGWMLDQMQSLSVLHGENHSWARLKQGREWTDYAVRTRLKLRRGAIHLNIRVSDAGRYFLGLIEDGLYLNKEAPWGSFHELAATAFHNDPDKWLDLEIRVVGNQLQVLVDGELKLEAVDANPLTNGSVAFETLERASAYLDYVEVDGEVAAAPLPVFVERYPTWNRADLTLLELRVEPQRADPGQTVTIHAKVANLGNGPIEDARVRFTMDDREVGVRALDSLFPADEQELTLEWRVEEPGPHDILGSIELGRSGTDGNPDNDVGRDRLWVSSEVSPQADLDISTELDPLAMVPGEPYSGIVRLFNPSFADIRDIHLQILVDGEVVQESLIPHMPTEANRQVPFVWSRVERGGHLLEVRLHLAQGFPGERSEKIGSWAFSLSQPTVLTSGGPVDQWVSLGPRTINSGINGAPNGSVGRIHHIALHPTNAKILYASTPRGGLWKSDNGGSLWKPLGDKLASTAGGPVAIDPNYPYIIYYATGYPWNSAGVGIFKSVDSGKNWDLFANAVARPTASDLLIKGTSQLIIRYPNKQSKQITIYAATNVGVLRYTSTNPWAKTSKANEWTQIKTGIAADLVVPPTSDSTLYASIKDDGVWRTKKGASATGDVDWQKLSNGLPAIVPKKTGGWFTLDIYRHDPKIVYAALSKPGNYSVPGAPGTLPTLGVFKTSNGGDSWKPENLYANGGLYNAFVRSHPTMTDIVYFGGVKLYKQLFSGSPKPAKVVGNIHDDMHELVWDQHTNNKYYYVVNDGGIWYCEMNTGPGDDSCIKRTWDLRVTEFYDLDVSQSNPQLMIGGTQDNGTILYQGSLDWKFVKGGDGNYSLIAPGNKVLYAQHQALQDTLRCDAGVNCWHNNWVDANKGLPQGDAWKQDKAFITVHPQVSWWLLSQGAQVFESKNSGMQWSLIGPTGPGVKGYITRVLFSRMKPDHTIIAGTSAGQIWMGLLSSSGYNWKLLWDRNPSSGTAAVRNMALSTVDPHILYVVFSGGSEWAKIYQFEISTNPPGAVGYPITRNFPAANLTPLVISGDPNNANVAYVGSGKGVYRGEGPYTGGLWQWTEYNTGFPLVEVTDLLAEPKSKQLRAATRGRGAWAVSTRP